MLMEDKRILRTKAQFRQALITLLDQKRFEQITIKALCDQAGITASPFMPITQTNMSWRRTFSVK